MQKNYYQILGIAKDASSETLQAAHLARRQQFSTHPDIVLMLDEAAQVLGDETLRKAYDKSLIQTARIDPPQITISPTFRGERKSGLRGVHFFLLGLLAAGGYGWHAVSQGKTRPNPLPAPSVAPTPHAEQPMPQAGAATQEPAIISLTPIPPMPAAPGAAQETAPPRFVRPEKKPGFDPEYMAWTVYQIVGAKGRGSGVMLERDKIVTNCHVIAGSYQPRSITAINSVTREAFYPEKIAILSDSEDVCLLYAPGAPDYVAQWGSAKPLEIGARTYTVSFPGREGLKWSAGNLLARESISGLDVLLTSNYCRPGVSGGALFDGNGHVIGITSAGRLYRTRSGDVLEGECISIEAETAKEVMWRTLMSLAIAPIKYQGVWSGGR